jgi:hypothetical protein
MALKIKDCICTVIAKDGKHFLITPKGEEIKGLIMTRITDTVGEMPYAIVKLYVNIKNTEE